MITYLFDGSFYGLLTAIFESYERKHKQVRLIAKERYLHEFFTEPFLVISDKIKAKRVWKGIKKNLSPKHQRTFYSAYLSEQSAIYQSLFNYALLIFDSAKGVEENYGNPHVLAINQVAQQVQREKHRMKAFIRFQKSAAGVYSTIIKPDFNVLPLIVAHFKNRYADQQWLIYDEYRKYGLYYDQTTVREVTLAFKGKSDLAKSEEITFDENEALYQTLWQSYFHSTNIQERQNKKLHIQHVPKRYWRYLIEKKNNLR